MKNARDETQELAGATNACMVDPLVEVKVKRNRKPNGKPATPVPASDGLPDLQHRIRRV